MAIVLLTLLESHSLRTEPTSCFMRSSADQDAKEDKTSATTPFSSITALVQRHRTRRRRGSLRKAALLGRGAQNERRDARPLMVDAGIAVGQLAQGFAPNSDSLRPDTSPVRRDPLGLGISNPSLRGSHDGMSDQLHTYNSTTDEEDMIQIRSHSDTPSRSGLALPLTSEAYYGSHTTTHRQRSFQRAKSPLSFGGISTPNIPPTNADWDYSETTWWGWVVLTVIWFVFVVGMGSCLDVWSWAWDVGTTPYAPPELEDDPTLPIVGYYPALIILTSVMAWVWVVAAWVGMKYFRHAKISGD